MESESTKCENLKGNNNKLNRLLSFSIKRVQWNKVAQFMQTKLGNFLRTKSEEMDDQIYQSKWI